MASIRIRVGAVLDPGATRVFDPLVGAAQRAAKAIARAGKSGAEEYVGGYRSAPGQLKKVFDDAAKAAEDADRRASASGRRASEERTRAAEHESRTVERLLHRQEAERKRVISSAARTFGGVVRAGAGLAGEVARGAGVDLSVGSLVGRNVGTQKAATDITNSAYVEGAKGSVGTRQDPAAVIAKVKEAADAAAIGEDAALAGLQKFVGKSTDLATGMEVLKKMAVLSKATGSSMEDMLDAAGDVAVKLEDGADKGEILYGLMKSVAKQGQVGASEIRSMAPFIGRIASSAKNFEGGVEGAVRELGTVFQITKKEQGLTVGSAATATGRFVDSLKSKGGMKALAGIGVKDSDIFTKGGQMKHLSDLIPMIMEKTQGDPRKIARAFPNVMAARVANAFAGVYRTAEGEKKGSGKGAVRAAMGEYGGAMSEGQIQESLARAMATTESKAQLFQNRLQAIADENLPRVMESLERLAPLAMSAAEGFAKFVGWASENPFQAVGAALAASVAKAALGSALEAGLAKALGGTAGLSITAATATVAGAALIYLTVQKEKKAGAEDVYGDVSKAARDLDAARAEQKKGGISPEMRDKLERERETLASDLALGAKPVTTGERLQAVNPFSDTTIRGLGQHEGAADAGFQADAAARVKEIDALLGKGADGHVKAAGALTKAAQALEDAAGAFKPVGGFGPGATTGPAAVR